MLESWTARLVVVDVARVGMLGCDSVTSELPLFRSKPTSALCRVPGATSSCRELFLIVQTSGAAVFIAQGGG
jgi:hypothetical protein